MKRKMTCFYSYATNELCNFDKFEKSISKINPIKIVYTTDTCNVMHKVNINTCPIQAHHLFVTVGKKEVKQKLKIRLDRLEH